MKYLEEVFDELLPMKKEIYSEHRKSNYSKSLALADYAKQFHPEFYIKVLAVIDKLGSITENEGYSSDIDFYKVKFYGLINL